MHDKNYDFSGWATKCGITCSDGRVIGKNAFKECDGTKVPIVWMHNHKDIENVLGHAYLENRDEGVYAYCYLNATDKAENAKEMIKHGDLDSLSIYANHLKHKGSEVLHGVIQEVSLVLKGANKGALIDAVLMHGDEEETEGTIWSGETISLEHSDDDEEEPEKPASNTQEGESEGMKKEELNHSDENSKSDKTVEEVLDTLNEEQLLAVAYLMQETAKNAKNVNEEDSEMKHNVFEEKEPVVAHSTIDFNELAALAKKEKSFRAAAEILMHRDYDGDGQDDADPSNTYGVGNIDFLFPDHRELNTPPEFISRIMTWVPKVMSGVHRTPFSRIKTTFADITADEARALGYIKGKKKKEEVFPLLKRTTEPTTIYKKQRMDRDDAIDIATGYDFIGWLKAEMRTMLDEEIARAILIGDGRESDSIDHIDATKIRPIYTDADLYTIRCKVQVAADATDQVKSKAIIKAIIKSRKDYRGSGNPTFFTTEDVLTDMLLIEDGMGRPLYDTEEKLRTALRVKEIVTVPVMENVSRTTGEGVDEKTYPLVGIIVNLNDYNVGADKGGSVNMFDDFDIDYNQQVYLMETRCSGALVKPYSAIAVELDSNPS